LTDEKRSLGSRPVDGSLRWLPSSVIEKKAHQTISPHRPLHFGEETVADEREEDADARGHPAAEVRVIERVIESAGQGADFAIAVENLLEKEDDGDEDRVDQRSIEYGFPDRPALKPLADRGLVEDDDHLSHHESGHRHLSDTGDFDTEFEQEEFGDETDGGEGGQKIAGDRDELHDFRLCAVDESGHRIKGSAYYSAAVPAFGKPCFLFAWQSDPPRKYAA
jgi:hypothetical protein